MSQDRRLPPDADWLQVVALADALLSQGGAGGVFALDRQCRCVYWSPAMERMLGVAASEVLGRDLLGLFPFLTAIGEEQYYRAALEGQVSAARDRSFWVPESSREGTFDAHYVPVRARDGAVIGVAALITETTERRRIELHVRETEQRFQIMADAAPVLLWMARADGMCTFFNQTWIDWTGRSQAEEWGVGWSEGVHFEDLQRVLDTYVEAFNQRRVFEMEYRLRRADGKFRWVLDRGAPRHLPDGTFAGYIGSCIDITDRRHAETELRRNVVAKDEFLGLVSHELRTPTTALQLQVELLQRLASGALSPRAQDVVDRMATTTARLAHLIESVLHVCRIDTGRLRLDLADFDLAPVVTAVIDELRPNADKKGLQLLVRIAPDLPALHSDPEIVRMVISNLVSNAIKFTDAGHVGVSVRYTGSAHRVAVHDTGQGIPQDQHTRIFGVFERLEATRKKHTPGVGLGLSLVKAMTQALGGAVTLESEIGRGSLFTVDLPPSLSVEPKSHP